MGKYSEKNIKLNNYNNACLFNDSSWNDNCKRGNYGKMR